MTNADSSPTALYGSGIPIRNLWLLMLYASDLFRLRQQAVVGGEENPDELPELLAEILVHAVEKRLRRQLSMGHRIRAAPLNRVRGRIDVRRTECRQLLARGQVFCRFGELTIDTPRNRYVRRALEKLSRLVLRQRSSQVMAQAKRGELARACRTWALELYARGVQGPVPATAVIRTDRFGLHDSEDRFMVEAARLAHELVVPTETAGNRFLVSPDGREEAFLRGLFERAVGGFFSVALAAQGWRVTTGQWLAWPMSGATEGIRDILPGMQTDIVLTYPPTNRRIVIDTKFAPLLKAGRYRATVKSAYLYQMYAYLQSQAGRGPAYDAAEGVLLHPSLSAQPEDSVDEAVVIQGHPIRFATVRLAGAAAQMRRDLLRLTEAPAVSPPEAIRAEA